METNSVFNDRPLPDASPAPSPGVESDTQLPITKAYHPTPIEEPEPGSLIQAWTLPARIGQYTLLEELARGGMGVVYRAHHLTLDRPVALKTMRVEALALSDNALRFEREVRAAARLSHPHIVPIYEVGQHSGLPYYAMALVTGGSLIKHRERLHAEPDLALALMEKVARAVHYAHEQGIVHRDLKPGNILLDQNGEPLVADFGLARIRDSIDLTQTGVVLGTPGFMAPEQAAGRSRDVGPASDIWALGVMLYDLLTGRRPFAGDSDELRRQVLAKSPPGLRTLRPALNRDVERVVLKCLEKEPYCRYPSAEALADDLARCRRGEPPTHVHVSLPSRARRLVRRHPRWIALLGMAAFLAAILPIGLHYTDPDRPAHDMLAELTRGEKVTLIGSEGGPRWSKWIIGQGAVLPTSDSVFCLQTYKAAYLALLPSSVPAPYRFRAEIRPSLNRDHEAGIFFAHSRQITTTGPTHSLLALLSANRLTGLPPDPRKPRRDVELLTFCVPESGPRYSGSTGVVASFAPDTAQTGERWHALEVVVTSQGARVIWEDKPPQQRTFADSINQARLSLQGQGVPDLELNCHGALGLFLDLGVVSFRNVTVTPE